MTDREPQEGPGGVNGGQDGVVPPADREAPFGDTEADEWERIERAHGKPDDNEAAA